MEKKKSGHEEQEGKTRKETDRGERCPISVGVVCVIVCWCGVRSWGTREEVGVGRTQWGRERDAGDHTAVGE